MLLGARATLQLHCVTMVCTVCIAMIINIDNKLHDIVQLRSINKNKL
eukprot:SAG11_NODE_827_length_6974_cov_4.300945_5_plen_47_part_00